MIKIYTVIISVFICISLVFGKDEICDKQKDVIKTAFQKQDPISKYQFSNDSKTSLEVTWLGENSGKIILVTSAQLIFGQSTEQSDIYLSINNGKNFTKITEKLPIPKIIVRRDNGLQRSTVDTNFVFIVGYDPIGKSSMVISHDAGVSWKKANLEFTLDKFIVYHPKNKLWMLTLSSTNSLFKSVDGGLSWTNILDNVYQFAWSSFNSSSEVIFAKVGKPQESKDFVKMLFERLFNRQSSFTLKKYDGKSWTVINSRVFGFLVIQKFLYVSEVLTANRRRLIVSKDEGLTFNRVYLPTIVNQQFYSILDIEEDLVFIHVDNDDNNGDGTLFTSDSDGQVFRQSLLNHFYPSKTFLSDFYKVESMRGTYLASQLKPDKSIQTLITFNRGAEWKKINKPESEPCHDATQANCYLQIANGFSIMKRVMSYLPLSSRTAVGLILAHGHLAESLKNSKTDVYISSNGGYNWTKSLSGPHQYVIADHGGLLVALGENNQIIKFSTDEGRCWHEHQYTKETIRVTGLLTEPGNKAMTVAIWGYVVPSNHWVIHVVDLSEVLSRECNDGDYEQWYAHSEMTHPNGKEYMGCLLGKKENFLRLKKDSLCRNGYSHEIKKSETFCPCTQDDFECEYGYYRTVNSPTCIRNLLVTENICVKGVKEQLITKGYNKIPSDVCKGGYTPDVTKQKLLNVKCNEDDDNSWRKVINSSEKKEVNNSLNQVISQNITPKPLKSTASNFIYIIVGVAGGFVGLFVIVILVNRARNVRKKHSNLKYRVLAGLDKRNTINEDDDDAALLSNDMSYESLERTTITNGKIRKSGDDSDVDLIG